MGALLHQGSSPVVASSVGFIAGAALRFLTAYFGVFEPKEHWTLAAPRFVSSLVVQFAVNAGLMYALLSMGVPVWWAQLLVTGSVTLLNFAMYRLWVFR
jgi:putative flippase GtrA